jgi:hypothetical protein
MGLCRIQILIEFLFLFGTQAGCSATTVALTGDQSRYFFLLQESSQ